MVTREDWNDEIINDLRGKLGAYEAEIWAHDLNASKFKKHALICQIIMIAFSAITLLFGNAEAYIDPLVYVWISGFLKAGTLASTSFYGWYNPAEQRMQHIIASNQKGGVYERIKQQLLMPLDRRENAVDFDRWIGERIGSIGASTPYLPAGLLAKYPKKKNE